MGREQLKEKMNDIDEDVNNEILRSIDNNVEEIDISSNSITNGTINSDSTEDEGRRCRAY